VCGAAVVDVFGVLTLAIDGNNGADVAVGGGMFAVFASSDLCLGESSLTADLSVTWRQQTL